MPECLDTYRNVKQKDTTVEKETEFAIEFKFFYDINPINIIHREEKVIANDISIAYYKIRQKYPNVKIIETEE